MEAPPIPPKKLNGIEITNAQGQDTTKNVNALYSHSKKTASLKIIIGITARAIAKNPEIFIFDDSFSALDYKTDVVLRKALKKETKYATTIIVAQRISTILHAEQIIVLDEGRIVGKGTHKELLKNCDVYKQIALSQLSEKELHDGKEEA